MAFTESVIKLADTYMLDAFSRLRVSQPTTVFDSKQLNDNLPLLWDDQEVSGSGTSSTHNPLRASTTLSVSAFTAGKRVRQTYRRFNYQPAKSQLIVFSLVPGIPKPGITKRFGYYDENNGLIFEIHNGELWVNQRSGVSGSPENDLIPRSKFNVDKFNSQGNLREEINLAFAQILFFDMEWLGVGRTRFGAMVNGNVYDCHHYKNSNQKESVYMSTPNLPLRFEIENDGTGEADQLEQICATVISEGGEKVRGLPRLVSRKTSQLITPADSKLYPLLSIRLKQNYLGSTVYIDNVNVMNVSAMNDYEVVFSLKPVINGIDAADWKDLLYASVEYDISRDANNNILSELELGGFLGSSSATDKAIATASLNELLLGSAINGEREELTVAVRSLSSNPGQYYCNMTIGDIL